MPTPHEVQRFLSDFKTKMDVFGIIFRDDRSKNFDTTTALELTVSAKMKILKCLSMEDYAEGPLEDKLNSIADMWVFGKYIKGSEVYIKISMGRPGLQAICISFHFSEHPIKYPFKENKR